MTASYNIHELEWRRTSRRRTWRRVQFCGLLLLAAATLVVVLIALTHQS